MTNTALYTPLATLIALAALALAAGLLAAFWALAALAFAWPALWALGAVAAEQLQARAR